MKKTIYLLSAIAALTIFASCASSSMESTLSPDSTLIDSTIVPTDTVVTPVDSAIVDAELTK